MRTGSKDPAGGASESLGGDHVCRTVMVNEYREIRHSEVYRIPSKVPSGETNLIYSTHVLCMKN